MGAYTRAQVDRASLDTDGPIRFVAATEGVKADGIDLRMSGAKLDRYRANPIFGYGHQYWSREDLPIGKATSVEVDGSRLLLDVVFDPEDEFARACEKKYRGGYLNACSIGFDVHAWQDGNGSYWKGGVAESWELTEVSAVPVPMDAEAVVAGGRAMRAALLGDLDVMLAGRDAPVPVESAGDGWRSLRITDELIRGADPVLLGLHIARALRRDLETDVPPELADVDDDAARHLLAAFALERG